MTRRGIVGGLASVFGIIALGLCLVSITHRARAGNSPDQGKKAKPASSASVALQPVPFTSARVEVAATASAVPPAEPAPDRATPTATAPASHVTEELDLTSIPTGGGLPVAVNIAVSILEIQSFDDVKGEFDATTDVRLRWADPRLRYKAAGVADRYREYRGKVAEERLEKLWTPNIDLANRTETTGYVGHRLRVFADGQVETMVRATGHFKTNVDVQNFPFDSQALTQTFIVRDQTIDEVMLRFDKDDEEFSRASDAVKLDTWKLGDVDLDTALVSGWNGDRYSKVTASLMVKRAPTTGLTTIFIPLVASLLIPLLALWLNRATPEGFELDAFELANMGIGGLFSVIALSYAVSSAYGNIASSDNTVTRLFALNYVMLAVSLGVVLLFYHFNFVRRHFGPYIHQQVFKFIVWALPVLSLGTSIAFVLLAAC